MKKLVTLMVVLCSIMQSCQTDKPDKNAVRAVFDSDGLQFISSSLNQKNQKMSALYGNQAAIQSLADSDSLPRASSVMKFVTWKYHEHPNYIGSTINGELLSVETVFADKNGMVTYQRKNVDKNESTSTPQKDRINYLMSFKLVSSP